MNNHRDMDNIFVYGSLLSKLGNPMHQPLEKYAELIGWGTVQGKLINIGDYPGLIVSGDSDDQVKGEVYRVCDPESLFSKLDRYEGCSEQFPEPHQYVRKQVSVNLLKNGKAKSWAYLYNLDTSGLEVIPSGFYLDHILRQ